MSSNKTEMNHPESTVSLTRRGRLVRTAVGALSLSLATATVTPRVVDAISDMRNPYPDCIQTSDVPVPPGGSLWGLAENILPDEDPREVVAAIRHFTPELGSDGQPIAWQEVRVPTPATFHC